MIQLRVVGGGFDVQFFSIASLEFLGLIGVVRRRGDAKVTNDINRWLEQLDLGQYAEAFQADAVDVELLPDLDDADLVTLGVAALGHRKKLLRAIAELDGKSMAEPSSVETEVVGQAERRQLTVMFCDLVGSTELSRRLDPEDLRDVMRRYQDVVAGAVTRYGGHVAKYLGDGVLAYFGWPQAHENQGERAIRAGLEAAAAVNKISLENAGSLSARVGIASGQVIVGDLVGDAGSDTEAVTGETPNLAARLQGVAEPGLVVIGAATRRLVGNTFELEALGPQNLKGFAETTSAWSVVGEGPAESRFEAAQTGSVVQFVGRAAELRFLGDLWTQARDRQGQAVVVSGEAGIGKSRLVQALRDEISGESYFRLRYQCSSLFGNSAFHPIIQRLERAAGYAADATNAEKLDKLEELLGGATDDVESTASLFADLLSIPANDRYGASDLDAATRRNLTIEALIDQVLTLARMRPVLFVLEDAQWIDPSTADFLAQLILRISQAAVLVVITRRPDPELPWRGFSDLTSVQVTRLDRAQSTRVATAAAGQDLAPDLIDRIVARADGVPLYLEALTKTIVEAGISADGAAADDAIPLTLQASLTARLDRLNEAKETAQIGALIGRSFSPELLAAVMGTPLEDTISSLDRLVEAEMVSVHGVAPKTIYTFKHALIQDVAYDTLLRRKRREVHARVADVLLRDFPDQADTGPEQVAHHLSLAGLSDRAVDCWLRAGQRAGERSAHLEAIAHLERGLEELKQLPQSASEDEREFALRIALGASLLTVEGWSAPKVADNYERAQELSVGGGDVRKLFMALRGLANVSFLNGEVENARQLVDRLLTIAREQDDTALLLQAYLGTGMCGLFVGDFAAGLENLQRANAMYERAQHHALAFVSGTDPAVVGFIAAGWAHWFLGHPREAIRDSEAALSLASELDHPFSLAYAQSLAASLHQFRRDPDAVLEHADAAIATAERHDFLYWSAWAKIMRGWALAALGDTAEGIAVLRDGREAYESTGARQITPYILTMLAEMHGWAGQPQLGIETLAEPHGPGNDSDVRFYEVESLRVKGELACQIKANDGPAYFAQALDLSRRQGARMLELRAAIAAARAFGDGEARETDRQMIQTLHDTFDPGLAEPDLSEARRFLQDAEGPARP